MPIADGGEGSAACLVSACGGGFAVTTVKNCFFEDTQVRIGLVGEGDTAVVELAEAAGLRYVLYMYMTALDDPSRLIAMPAGYALAPEGEERVGDVSNVLFSNGWIADDDGWVFLYYASSDTRMHGATSTVDRLVDYCLHTPSDGLTTAASVERLNELIDRNLDYERKNNR